LHRSIDTYTDHHPAFLESRNRLQPTYGKFSGVIVDIYYDHFLAREWKLYSQQELSEYALYVYELLLRNYSILPARSKRILPYMIILNWLVGYGRFSDLQWVFNGMSRRSSKYHSGMETAVESLRNDYDAYKKEFSEFFPDMILHAAEIRAGLNV
jgi:acyl carrier protein phosphodiesterase